MKRIVLTVLACVLGAAVLIGGSIFAAYMHDQHTFNFDRYKTTLATDGDWDRWEELKSQGIEIRCPRFSKGAPELWAYYREVDAPCNDYAMLVACKYNNNADLDFTTDVTGGRLTVKFSGIGYPENGEPEMLERTYIFDIENVGGKKLPKLLNRAEFIGY